MTPAGGGPGILVRRRGLFFITSWISITFLNAFIIAPAPAFPLLRETLQVSNAAAGALISVLLLTAIFIQVPGAYLIDRWDNRRIVVGAVVLLNLVSLPALLFRYDVLLLSRALAGLFVPLIFVSIANLVGHAFKGNRVRALGAYLSSPPAGYALGTFATPLVLPVVGLPYIFVVYSLPMLALLPLFYFTGAGIGQDRGPVYPLRKYAEAFRAPELWRLGAAFAATYALYILFTSWMPTFLAREGGMSPEVSGSLAALVPALGILSRPIGGQLADTVFRRDKRGVLLTSFLPLIPLTLLWTVPASTSWAPVLLVLAGFFIQLPFSVYYAFSSQILPSRMMGSAYTFMNTTSLVGGTVAPYVAGYLLDVTGSFQSTFLLAGGLAAAGLLLSLTSKER